VVSFVVGWVGAAKTPDPQMLQRLYGVCASVFRFAAQSARGAGPEAAEQRRALLIQIARLDDMLDHYGAGSVQARGNARALRAVLSALVSVVLWFSDELNPAETSVLAGHMQRLAQAFAPEADASARASELAQLNAVAGLPRPLKALVATLQLLGKRYPVAAVDTVARRRFYLPNVTHHAGRYGRASNGGWCGYGVPLAGMAACRH
jgi:hypothetical protein